MYAYRRRPGARSGPGSTHRYFSSFDRFVVMLGVAAVVAFVVDGVATHGDSMVSTLQHLLGIAH